MAKRVVNQILYRFAEDEPVAAIRRLLQRARKPHVAVLRERYCLADRLLNRLTKIELFGLRQFRAVADRGIAQKLVSKAAELFSIALNRCEPSAQFLWFNARIGCDLDLSKQRSQGRSDLMRCVGEKGPEAFYVALEPTHEAVHGLDNRRNFSRHRCHNRTEVGRLAVGNLFTDLFEWTKRPANAEPHERECQYGHDHDWQQRAQYQPVGQRVSGELCLP